MHIKAEGGHDPIWYFSCLFRKFSELRALLFLSSTQTSQNLKFTKKCPCLSSLKNKFQWTQKIFWPLIRKILMWIFWVMLWSKSILTNYPVYLVILKMKFQGVFRPFIQRPLHYSTGRKRKFLVYLKPIVQLILSWIHWNSEDEHVCLPTKENIWFCRIYFEIIFHLKIQTLVGNSASIKLLVFLIS